MGFFSKIKKELGRFESKVRNEVKRIPENTAKYGDAIGAAMHFVPGLGTIAGGAFAALAKGLKASKSVAKVASYASKAQSLYKTANKVRTIASAFQDDSPTVRHTGMVLPADHPAMQVYPGQPVNVGQYKSPVYSGRGPSTGSSGASARVRNIANNTARNASRTEEKVKRSMAAENGETHELPNGRVKVWLERVDAFLNLRGRDYE